MKHHSPIQSPNHEIVQAQVKATTPESIIALIARQLDIANEAQLRIAQEGIVVRDMKGSVVEHPCIKTELTATKAACELLGKHKKLANQK